MMCLGPEAPTNAGAGKKNCIQALVMGVYSSAHQRSLMNKTADLDLSDVSNVAAANRARGLAAQAATIDAASAGSAIYHTAASYLAANPKVKVFQKESVSATGSSKK